MVTVLYCRLCVLISIVSILCFMHAYFFYISTLQRSECHLFLWIKINELLRHKINE